MKYPYAIFLLAILVGQSPVWAQESPVLDELQLAAKLSTYRESVKQFAGQLRTELMQAMKSGGPIAALEVCQIKAPTITDAASKQSGYRIARTSLKTRNPDNAPDAWEQAVLENFNARQAAGAAPQQLEYHEIIRNNGDMQLRYMKAIPTGAPCLMCHGDTEVSAEVDAKIMALYPDDQARGFKVGDIRGAFTFTEVLTGQP